MIRPTVPLACLAGLLIAVNLLKADSLVTYTEFEEDPEGEPLTSPTSLHPSLSAPDIALAPDGNITLGDTHDETWESPLPYLQARGGWDAENADSAKAFTFTLTADESSTFSLTELRFEDRATSGGPSAMTVSINDTPVLSKDIADSSTELNTVDLTEAGLENLSTAEFVFAGWDNNSRSTTGGGDWRTAGYEIEGTVSVIPEPSFFAFAGGGAALLLTWIRRRRSGSRP